MRKEFRGRGVPRGGMGRRFLPSLALVLALPFLMGQAAAPPAGTTSGPDPGWIRIDYGRLVDRRQLSHSGASVGELLRGLAERGGLDAPDPLSLSLLDPLLEPYAFVLQDMLDSMAPMPEPPMVEVGRLWLPGQAQPAWAELLRARRYLVESDGAGRMRICLPWTGRGGAAEKSAGQALREAASAAWPVLRHLFAAEQRRLARAAGGSPEERPLQVELRVYRHEPGRSAFLLGEEQLDLTVTDTRPAGNRPPLDLETISTFLDSGLRLEGARLEPDGSLRLLGSPTEERPALLGRPLELSDFAVAYRAVFHGGFAEPYMSLDRGWSPQTSIVNYGGRLRDTAPGLVSLLCDIRFKTFSMGLGIEEGRDLREEVRAAVPSFRSHLERFAFHPGASGVMAQQTRLWFYPDSVDLTVSPQGDLLAFRRVRMTASSERVVESSRPGATAAEPPWTRATVEAINRDYDGLAGVFPEMADLDQVVRLLSLFTWLRQAEADGLLIPELDVLLALELPALPTPRRYPQLLAFNALPPADREGEVLAFDRVPVGEALDRLEPASGRPLPARRRLARAMAALDPNRKQNAALLEELRAMQLDRLDESQLDRLTSRAERLRMHQLVLSTLEPERREELVRRREAGETPRIFSVGIGGLDLGMDKVVNRARGRSLQLGAGRAGWSAGAASRPVVAQASPTPAAGRLRRIEPREEWRVDSRLLPALDLPDHGLGAGREFGAHRIETADLPGGEPGARATRSVSVLMGADGPEASGRTVRLDARGMAREIDRLEAGRLVRYRFEGDGRRWTAVPAELSDPAPGRSPAVELPEGLATLTVVPTRPSAGDGEPPAVRLRLRGAGRSGSRPLEAGFPRPLLQRIVLGREADLSPGRPLSGFDPLPEALGEVGTLMVLVADEQRRPPWQALDAGLAGEEDPIRLARALGNWWADPESGTARRGAVAGTDPERSVERWRSAPRPAGPALLLLPEDAFPGPAGALRADLGQAWPAGLVVGELPARTESQLIVLVSAESPGLFAARLRALARRPELQGKLLAAWCLAGPVRQDLPASLLAEGRLAGLGLAEATFVGRRQVVERLVATGRSASRAGGELRVELLDGPFLWFF